MAQRTVSLSEWRGLMLEEQIETNRLLRQLLLIQRETLECLRRQELQLPPKPRVGDRLTVS